MKINCTLEWDEDDNKAGNLPEEVEVDLSTLNLLDVTEENSSDIAEYISAKFGGACLLSFDYQVV